MNALAEFIQHLYARLPEIVFGACAVIAIALAYVQLIGLLAGGLSRSRRWR